MELIIAFDALGDEGWELSKTILRRELGQRTASNE